MSKKIIAIVGMSGSGKSEAGKFFQKNGYEVLRFGLVIDEAIKNAGLPWTPKNNVIFRKKVREKLGMAAVAIKLFPKIEKLQSKKNKIVLDGLYSWDEYIYLKEKLPNLNILCVYTRPEIRYSRLVSRTERRFTRNEARERDITEIEDVQKGGPIAICDYLIKNESTMEELHKELKDYLQWIENE